MEPKSKWRAYRNTKITPLKTPPRPQTSSLLPSPKPPSPSLSTKLPSPSTRAESQPNPPRSPSHPPRSPSTAAAPHLPRSPSTTATPHLPRSPSKTATAASHTPALESSECEELNRLVHAPPFWKSKKRLSKQLSMCETARDLAWEKRRRQILRQERRKNGIIDSEDLTDEDLHELKGCIELGFGFNEEDGQRLCNTLPALDLYFAINRQLSPSPVSTPKSRASAGSLSGRSSSLDSPLSEESWRICSPGENPQQVKTKLRHWAQAVACSVMQSF